MGDSEQERSSRQKRGVTVVGATELDNTGLHQTECRSNGVAEERNGRDTTLEKASKHHGWNDRLLGNIMHCRSPR
jgi:hypothetical protein